MSQLKVEVVEIDEILEHPNADSLELARIKGWICIVKKGVFKSGDKCIYAPIDSVLPYILEDKLFSDAKVKLSKGRIKTIKLRGSISQGLVINPKTVGMENKKVGADVTKELGIEKYEPPQKSCKSNEPKYYKYRNPNFKKYTDMENYKNYVGLFKEGEPVVVTEKIHGTNWRAGWVPTVADTFWKKVKKFFGRLPEYEFVYGSRNVQLHDKKDWKGFYPGNVYYKIVEKYDIKNKLKPNEVIYGEVYGDGIQGNYSYGLKGEMDLVIFDMMHDGDYMCPKFAETWCENRNLPFVPVLYEGPFSIEKIVELSKGASVLCPDQKVREGVVIKLTEEAATHMGRKVLKYVSDEYLLLKGNTDFH